MVHEPTRAGSWITLVRAHGSRSIYIVETQPIQRLGCGTKKFTVVFNSHVLFPRALHLHTHPPQTSLSFKHFCTMNRYANTVKVNTGSTLNYHLLTTPSQRNLAKQHMLLELGQLIDALHLILLYQISEDPVTAASGVHKESLTCWSIFSPELDKETYRIRIGLMISRKGFRMTWSERQTDWIRRNADKAPLHHALLKALESLGLSSAAYNRIRLLGWDGSHPTYPATDFNHKSLDGLLEGISAAHGDGEGQTELREVIRIVRDGLTEGVIRTFGSLVTN